MIYEDRLVPYKREKEREREGERGSVRMTSKSVWTNIVIGTLVR